MPGFPVDGHKMLGFLLILTLSIVFQTFKLSCKMFQFLCTGSLGGAFGVK